MALIRNGSNQLTGLSRFHGAVGAYGLRASLDSTGKLKNFDSGEHSVSGVTNKSSRPAGASHPIAWKMGRVAGSLSSHNEARGSATASLSLASGRNVVGTSAGTSTGSATLQLVVSMSGTSAGSTTTQANINAALGLSGSAAGSCTVTGQKNALANCVGTAEGTSTASLTRYATGRLYGAITPFTELSPENLAASVWNSIAASYNDSGTMGEKLNGAGSAGNPWTEVIEAGYTAEEIMRVIAAALAGTSNKSGSTITFKGLDGTTDRIVGTFDSENNRTSATLNGA